METSTPLHGKERNFLRGDGEDSAVPVSERLQSPLVITGPDGKIMTWDTPQKKFMPWSASSILNRSRVKQQLLKSRQSDASSCNKPNPLIPSQSMISPQGCLAPQFSGKNGVLPIPQRHFWTPGRPTKTPLSPEYTATPITPPNRICPPLSSCRKPRSKSGMRLRMFDDEELQPSRVVQARQNLLTERQERAFTAWLNHVLDLQPAGGSQVLNFEDSVSRTYSMTSPCSPLPSTDLQFVGEANGAKDFVASPFRDPTQPSRSQRNPLAPLNGVGNRGFGSPGMTNLNSDRRPLKDVFSTPDGKSSAKVSPTGFHSSAKKLRTIPENACSSTDAHMQDVCLLPELARRLKLHFSQIETREILAVIAQLAKCIDEGRVRMKKGCVVSADVELRKKAIHVLLNYNACWMRIGLHVLLGHTSLLGQELHRDDSKQTAHKDVQDVEYAHLKVFIKRHFFARFEQETESTTNKITEGLCRDEHSETLERVILKRFFLLVLVLDKVKCLNTLNITDGIDGVDGGSPPLFRSDARLKSSRQVLQEFLSGVMLEEKDLIENLGAFGYHVHHYQVPLADYDFAVVNLIEDLQDGVRLCRFVHLLAGNYSRMLEHVQLPSNGQKRQLHNCQIALKGLARAGVPLEDEDGRSINAEDIIEGNKVKVFSLLWNIMVHLQIPVLVSRARLRQEIAKLQGTEGRVALGLNVGTVELLLKWTQVTCMISGNISIRNFKSSFGDGHAFFLILNFYLPHWLSGNALLSPSSHFEVLIFEGHSILVELLHSSELDWSDQNKLCSYRDFADGQRERENVLNTQKRGRISQDGGTNHPVDELVRSGSQRKLESESLSAFNRFYSVNWPLHDAHCGTMSSELNDSMTQVNENSKRILSEDIVRKACKIQAWWRALLIRQYVSSHQMTAQRVQIERQVSPDLKRAHSSALSIQVHWWGYVVRRMLKSWTAAAAVIQRRYRARRKYRKEQVAHFLQDCFRAWAQKRKYRANVSNMCKIQALSWASQARGNFERERKAVHTIESEWLHYVARRRLQRSVQTRWQRSESAQLIQAHWRGYFTRRILVRRSSAASVIQRWVRGHLMRGEYKRQKQRIVQAHVRAWIQNENIRRIRHTHNARIQACWRGHVAKRHFKEVVRAAKTIQTAWRFLTALRKRQLTVRVRKVESSSRIQARWRGRVARRQPYLLKQAATKIRRAWRVLVARQTEQQAATKIQTEWRQFMSLRKLHLHDSVLQSIIREQTTACTRIQAWWRKHAARQQSEIRNRAARKIQRKWRHWRAWARNVSAQAIQGKGRDHLDFTLGAIAVPSERYQYAHVRRMRFDGVQEGLATVSRTRHRAYFQRKIREADVTSAHNRGQFPMQRICDNGTTQIHATPPGMVERHRLGQQRKRANENQLVFRAPQSNTVSVLDQKTLFCRLRSAALFQTSSKRRLKLRAANHRYIVLLKIKSFCEVQQQCQQHQAMLLCQASESGTEANVALEHENMECGAFLEGEQQADSANVLVYNETPCAGGIFHSRYRGSSYTNFILMTTSPTMTIQMEVWRQLGKYLLRQLPPSGSSRATAILAIPRTICATFHSGGCGQHCDKGCLPRFLAAAHHVRRGQHGRENVGLPEEDNDTDRVDILTCFLCAGSVADRSSLVCKMSSPQKRNAAKVIFSWFQTFAQRAKYLRLRSCVVVIQRHLRGRINRSRFARIKASAIRVQAHWRGYRARRDESHPQNPLRDLRQRIRTTAVRVLDSARIYNRLAEALSTLPHQETVSGILSTCRTIDVATQHSYTCCQQLAEAGAITTILLLIQTINRSPPLEQVLKHALSILTNLAQYSSLATRVAESPSAINIISEQLHTFRNDERIFLQAISVIQMVCKTSAGVEVLQRERSIFRRLLLIAQSIEGNIQAEKRNVETLPWATPTAVHRNSAHMMRDAIHKFLSTVGVTDDVNGLSQSRITTSTTPLRRQQRARSQAQNMRLVAPTCLDAKRVGYSKLATTARQALSPRNGRSFSQ